jgi:predicted transcriptional regulator
MADRNITLKLPEETLKAVKVLAAERETSVSAMLNEVLTELVRRESGYRQAHAEFMRVAREGTPMSTYGRVSWTRDELHER